MPPIPPDQVSPFPGSRPAGRQGDPEPQQSKRGIVGRPRRPPPDSTPPMQPRVLRTPVAAKYAGMSTGTFEKYRVYGGGPRFVRIGPRAIGYTIEDLDAFIEAGRRTSTSDDGLPAPPRPPIGAKPPTGSPKTRHARREPQEVA
jgi:predicted DNA-binding transcriptional regulator AlpA